MTSRLRGLLGGALLLGSGASAAWAQQTSRPWTDPPVSQAPADETVTYPAPPRPAETKATPDEPAALEQTSSSAPATAPVQSGTVAAKRGELKEAPSATSSARIAARHSKPRQTVAREGRKDDVAAPSRPKKVAKRSVPSQFRGDAVGSRSRGSLADQDVAEVRPGYRRLRSVAEALHAGLTVTNVRTIQLPDGRLVEIQTEPDPRTPLNVVVRP
jgi:hypothetical protein